MIGVIRVKSSLRNTSFMTSKQDKIQVPTKLHNCKGFINDKFKGCTFIAHSSKGYDCHFILKWLIDQGIKPYCIYNRAKIMFMEMPKLSIRFINSLNFLQMPLKAFPKTFGMNELKKGYFPHYFNKKSSWKDVIQLENIDSLRYITIALSMYDNLS